MTPFVTMPAEWAPQTACLILYPHNPCIFRARCIPAREQVKAVAKAISNDGNEDVILFCKTHEDANQLQSELDVDKEAKRIYALVCPSDDTWARDTGPTFAYCQESSKMIGLDWDFNAYGGPESGCYWPCDLDKAVASNMCKVLSSRYNVSLETRQIPLVLEGGSIHVDGEGTVLTTKECLLNPNRNPHMTQEEIEKVVLNALGCTKMIWLTDGLAADEDTNGHIDNLACFTEPGHVVLSWTDDQESDPDNYERCRAAWKVLENETDAKGRKITVHKLYVPKPMYYTNEEVETLTPHNDGTVQRKVGERLAASYANFFIANDAVVVPQFGEEPWDARAIETLQGLFPTRKVVGVSSREILLGGGNIHCITQQVPKLP